MFDADAIQELAQAEAISAAKVAVDDAVGNVNTSGIVALPEGFKVHDLERQLPARRRLRGAMTTSVLADFASYAGAFKEAGATAFVDPNTMSATAVLNLGTPATPGHADNTAKLTLQQLAAYRALRKVASGEGKRQTEIAEFMEDWQDHLQCFAGDTEVPARQAIAAVRAITIENLKKLENKEQHLSAERTAFESIKATSDHNLPTRIDFRCEPYLGLQRRTFSLRLGVITGQAAPAVNLRIVNQELHTEQMAEELAALVRQELKDVMPVAIGGYAVAS